MLKLDKKQIKIVSLAVAVFFMLGVVGLAVSQTGKTSVASAGASSNIGVVNNQMLLSQHPDMAKAQEAMQAELDQAKKDFETKSATMNDKEKQDYYNQVQQRLSLKQQELIAPVFDKVNAAIKAVADAKGLAVVMDKSNVVYGGQDITDDVMKKISGK
jgi:outer membrane protein